MKSLFYTLVVALAVLWIWSLLIRSPGAGAVSGLRTVRMRPPVLQLWTPEGAKDLSGGAGHGSSLATLPPSLATRPDRTVVLETVHPRSAASPTVVARVTAKTPPPPRKPETALASPTPTARPVPCRRLVSIIHRSWALALARRFDAPPASIVKQLRDVRLYRVALVLGNAKEALSFAQRLERLGFPQPYYRHHGGQPELSLGVFLARQAALSLLARLHAKGLKPSLEVFLRPWTTYELVVHARRLDRSALERRYPGLHVQECTP